MDMLLNGSDLCRDICVLASKGFKAQPRSRWNALILSVRNNRQQLGRAIAALGRDNAELGHMSTDRIRQHRALTDQKLPAAVQHQAGLLLLRFDRHKTHRRPRHRLADCGSIIGVVFAALEIGFYIARRHQPHCMAERVKLATPMMCTRARFKANETGRQRSEELQHLCAAHTLADHHRTINIHAVNLEY
jgi:hypothetical protein